MLKIKTEYLILVLIVIMAAFLRLYRLPEMANFSFDQEYAANFSYAVVKEFPVQLIGQELSIQGLFIGPWYFYYLTPFFALTNLHPIGGILGSIFIGFLTILTYFFVGKKMFGLNAGLIAAFTRSILYIELEHDWSMAPAYAAEILVIITWYIFYKYWQGETKLFPILGFVFGLFTSMHPVLFPFYLVFIVLLLIKRKFPKLKIILFSIVSLVIPMIPLILFEYLHNFLEVKKLIELFTGPSTVEKGASPLNYYLTFNLSEPARILGLQLYSKELVWILLIVCLLFLLIRKIGFWKDSFHKISLLLTYIIFIGYYTLYPAHVPEYYFIALTSLMILYISASLSLLTKRKFLIPVLVLFIVNIFATNLNILADSKWNNPSLGGLHTRDQIVQEILKRQPKDQDFYVSYIKLPGWDFGFNYLFKLYGHSPQTAEVKQPIYTIVVPKSLSPDSIDIYHGNVGLILPE